MDLEFLFWVVSGFVLGVATIVGTRATGRDRTLLSGLLFVLGGWYLAWGAWDGRSFEVLLPQILGGAFFAMCGVLGLRVSLGFAALGWVLHAGWDFASPHISDVSYMPGWTAPVCLGYDLVLGVYLFRTWRQGDSPIPTDATEAGRE